MADTRDTRDEKDIIDDVVSRIMFSANFYPTKATHKEGYKQDFSDFKFIKTNIDHTLKPSPHSNYYTYAVQLQAINKVYHEITTDKSLLMGHHESPRFDNLFGRSASFTQRQIDAINILKVVYLEIAEQIIQDPARYSKEVTILNDDLKNERSLVNCKTSQGSILGKLESESKETTSHSHLKEMLSKKDLLRDVEVKKEAPSPKGFGGHENL